MALAQREITQRLVWLARTPGCGDLCGDRFGHHAETHEAYGAEQERLVRTAAVVETGVLTVDLAASRVYVSGREIRMAGRPWGVLALLATRVGDIVPRSEIVRTVWGPDWLLTADMAAHNVHVTRHRIRSMLGVAAPLVVTRGGYGMGLLKLPPGDMSRVAEQATCMSTRWARDWDACRRCGTTAKSHEGWGYCSTCIYFERQRRLSARQEDES